MADTARISEGIGVARRRFRISSEPTVIYAVGDVHGEFDKLIDLEREIVRDSRGLPGVKLIVMLGDYIDRGPRSAEVLDHLVRRPPAGLHRINLMGNHEAALLSVLVGRRPASSLIPLGGLATFASYGCDLSEYEEGLLLNDRDMNAQLLQRIPRIHRAFLDSLPILLESPGYLFVHAGVRPGIEIEDQSERDLLWIREPFLSSRAPCRKLVVHGHTPADEPRVGARRIGVDTGATYGGPLTCLRLNAGEASFLRTHA